MNLAALQLIRKVPLTTKKGFSLIEVLLATSVFALIVTALVGAWLYGQEATALAGMRARANQLAQEGQEAIRGIRDGAFSNLVDGTHGLAVSGSKWILSGSSDVVGEFTRTVTISTVDTNTKSISSSVSWQQNLQRTGAATSVSYLTDWGATAVVVPTVTKVAQYDKTNKDLKYGECSSVCTTPANWTFVAVDTAGDVGKPPSLALDTSGNPRIAYYDKTNKDLKYAECNTACTTALNWVAVTIDSVGDTGDRPSLALDTSGNLRVAYYDKTNKDLKYGECSSVCTTPANWTFVAVDTAGDVGKPPSLALDTSGNPRIAYYDKTNKDLKYAECNTACTTALNWTFVAVDTAGDVGKPPSLALDTSGNPRIAYRDKTNGDLKYAECNTACTTVLNWVAVTIDSVGDVGDEPSIALDSSGNPRIAYHDKINKDLKYAECNTACTTALNWTLLTVESAGDVGNAPSLVLDALGNPVIAHYDKTIKDLRYAECTTACTVLINWTTATIDSVGDVGERPSIAI